MFYLTSGCFLYFWNFQLSLNTKDLGQQSMNPKFFMDRLASIRKELGLESIGANDGDNSQDMDPDGRISSGLYGNTVMDFTTKVRSSSFVYSIRIIK